MEAREAEAEELLRAQGLTPERCGEDDWRLAIRETVERLTPPLLRVSSVLRSGGLATLTRPLDSTPAVAPREFACAACEDMQYVMTATHEVATGVIVRTRPVPCPACVPLPVRAALAGIPALFVDAALDTMVERPGNADALAMAREWDGTTSVVIASRADPGDSQYGTGKTHLAVAMLVSQIKRARWGRFMSEQDYLEGMKALFGSEPGAADGYADRIASEPLLAIDDLGKAQDTEWSRAAMFRLLDARYRSQRPTIITTNQTYRDLLDRLGGALVDRLHDARWVYVGGPSMRGA